MLTTINLLAHSYHNDSVYLLSINYNNIQLPFSNLDTVLSIDGYMSIEDIVKKLYKTYINLDYNWTKPQLVDVDLYKNNEDLIQTNIYYGCYVPYNAGLFTGYWVPANDVLPFSKILRKALLCSQ